MIGVIILAAGEGKRMKSDKAKVLHEVGGTAMIDYVLAATRSLNPIKIVLVVGNKMEQVVAHLKNSRVVFCTQRAQLGTADAVLAAEPPFIGFEGRILVLCGDMPLIRTRTLQALLDHHQEKKASATVLTGILTDPAQYGRIIRDEEGNLERIVEYADADDKIRAIKEVNSGTYVFEADDLWSAIEEIDPNNAQGEFYLTDVIEILKRNGKTVAAITAKDHTELLGVNTPDELHMAEELMAMRR